MKEQRELKGLKSQLYNMEGDEAALKIEVANIQREYSQKVKAIERLKTKIESIERTTKLKVSEHAMLRYLERVKGINLESLESEILSEEVRVMIETLGGTGGYPNKDFKVMLKNYTVTTIIK